MTDNPDCCNDAANKMGEFYYPNNSAVVFSHTNALYRTRGSQVVRLNKRNDVLSPTGVYRCEIADPSGRYQTIYVNIQGIFIYF